MRFCITRCEDAIDDAQSAVEKAREDIKRRILLAQEKIERIADNNSSEYLRAKSELEGALQDREALDTYQEDILTPARERMQDRDNPPTKEELEDLFDKVNTAMPDAVRGHLNKAEHAPTRPSSAAETYMGDTGMDHPDLMAHFDAVRLGIPDLEEPSPKVTSEPNPAG